MALRERQEFQCLFTGDPNSLKGCPQFVAKKLTQILEEYNDAPFEELEEVERTIRYLKIAGTNAPGYQKEFRRIGFWIGSSSNVNYLIHMGGSNCWIMPDSHYIHFEDIEQDQLPKHPSQKTWWAIAYPEEQAYFTLAEIEIVAPDEVPGATWYKGIGR